jgi:hypothetical protein
MADPYFSQNSMTLLANNEEHSSPKKDSKEDFVQAIEEYENEKLTKLKRNVGRRLLTVRTIKPAEFYESPDDLERKMRIEREKEGFVIVEVVQNQSGTMNFYKVRFDTGQTGYLSADGNHLALKIKEGSLISISKKDMAKKQSSNQSKAVLSEVIELVKNDLTRGDPATGEKWSVEKRMMDERARAFPSLKWKYEAKGIGNNRYRVTQYAAERVGPPLIRTWIVDLPAVKVKPENLAAREMYR